MSVSKAEELALEGQRSRQSPLSESPLPAAAQQNGEWQVVINTLSVFPEPENSVLRIPEFHCTHLLSVAPMAYGGKGVRYLSLLTSFRDSVFQCAISSMNPGTI